ncbi:GNAT family N-acetyltransferase [Amorphus sp. 3PC139-8]|uniref:GNAT family N-acetyltransferase n=1 Tax=Amorphus sp. 3PC139-8 TaxID=2735676 RepID=UPI00345C79B8
MTQASRAQVVIETLDPARHDRSRFSSGVAQVDNYFRKTANKLATAGNTRVFVMAGPDGRVVGFYALNAHAIDYQELPPKFARNRPSHGSIPAAFLSMIGVDQRFQGQGYGGDLLIDALFRVLAISEDLGIAVLVLDILDDGDDQAVARRTSLYAGYGFTPLPSQRHRMFLSVATIRKLKETVDRDV